MLKLVLASALALTPLSGYAQSSSPSALTSGFGFVALQVADLARAEAFYVNALGFKEIGRVGKPSEPVEKAILNLSGDPKSVGPVLILIHHAQPSPTQNRTTGTIIGFTVKDSAASAARVKDAGYTVVSQPRPGQGGAVLTSVVRDPDGVVVELVEMRAP